ncbi:hypothetical protein HDE_13568 [Halotydeus destructor]|nr:hypothetical protein HDE_13568 [Halotydeus destructor]
MIIRQLACDVLEAINQLVDQSNKAVTLDQLKDGSNLAELLSWVNGCERTFVYSKSEFRKQYVTTLSKRYCSDFEMTKVFSDSGIFLNSVVLFLNMILREGGDTFASDEQEKIERYRSTKMHQKFVDAVTELHLKFTTQSASTGDSDSSSCSSEAEDERTVSLGSSFCEQSTLGPDDMSTYNKKIKVKGKGKPRSQRAPATPHHKVNREAVQEDSPQHSTPFRDAADGPLVTMSPLNFEGLSFIFEADNNKKDEELRESSESLKTRLEQLEKELDLKETQLSDSLDKITTLNTKVNQLEFKVQAYENRTTALDMSGASVTGILSKNASAIRANNVTVNNPKSPPIYETPNARPTGPRNGQCIELGNILEQVGITGNSGPNDINSICEPGTLGASDLSRTNGPSVASQLDAGYQVVEIGQLNQLVEREKNLQETCSKQMVEIETLKCSIETLRRNGTSSKCSSDLSERCEKLLKENNDLKNQLIKSQTDLIRAERIIAWLKTAEDEKINRNWPDISSSTDFPVPYLETPSLPSVPPLGQRAPRVSRGQATKTVENKISALKSSVNQLMKRPSNNVAKEAITLAKRKEPLVRATNIRSAELPVRRSTSSTRNVLSAEAQIELGQRTANAKSLPFAHPSSLFGRTVTASNNNLLRKISRHTTPISKPSPAVMALNARPSKGEAAKNGPLSRPSSLNSPSKKSPAVCGWCGVNVNNKAGSRYDHLTKMCPQRYKHLGKGFFECEYCGAGYLTSQGLSKHSDVHVGLLVQTPKPASIEVDVCSTKRKMDPVEQGRSKRPRI